MRSLLTGHAVRFNRRHDRVGHVFQNRYRSIVCEEESYFVELVRYIHLNPLRAGIVRSIPELDTYPYSGHSAVLGTVPRRWQQTAVVLRRFGDGNESALEGYRKFVLQGAEHGKRPELVGGGLVRSAGGWVVVSELRRAREAFTHDDRVLGGSDFVESLLRSQSEKPRASRVGSSLEDVVCLVCRATKTDAGSLLGSRRSRSVSRAREGISFLWISHFGQSGHEVAAKLGISPVSAYRCARRGCRSRITWLRLLEDQKVTEGNNVPDLTFV
jgi:hypothetical protein